MSQADENVKWVISHATRSLVKQGHKRVYPLLGYTAAPNVAQVNLELACEELALGEALEFSFKISSMGKSSRKWWLIMPLDLLKQMASCGKKSLS